MKQTAVEWLVEELSDVLGPMDTNSIRDLLLMDAISRAKQMERANIIDAYLINPLEAKWKNIGTYYYNEIFKTNEK